MNISYDLFIEAFLDKVSEYDFLSLDGFTRNHIVEGYMKRACSQFNRVCKYDLTDRDDVVREFRVSIPDNEIDEIVDIVSDGMLVQWMKPFVNRQENLESVLNTRDFTTYSPAELLMRIGNAYEKAQKDYTQLVREYSYNHNDLSELHL